MGRDGLFCLVIGIAAVVGHVVTGCKHHHQFSGHSPIKGRLPQSTGHDYPILGEWKSYVCVCSKTHTLIDHIYLIPGQSPCRVPSGGEADEMDGGPRMERHVMRGSLQPYFLRRVCCKREIQKYDFGQYFLISFFFFFNKTITNSTFFSKETSQTHSRQQVCRSGSWKSACPC